MSKELELQILENLNKLENYDFKNLVMTCIDDVVSVPTKLREYFKLLLLNNDSKMPLKEFETICAKLNIKYKLFKMYDATKTKIDG